MSLCLCGSVLGFYRCLRGGEAGDGDTERRAGDVVEAGALAEVDRVGIAAVLAADAELEIGPRPAPALDGDLDRIARVILGVALIGIGVLAVGGGWGLALAAVCLVPLITGTIGWCPIYAIVGRGTKSDVEEGVTA